MRILAEHIVYSLLQSGLTVSLVALLAMGMRRIWAKRYPARAMCLVWAVLAIRLLIPIQLTFPQPLVQVAPTVSRPVVSGIVRKERLPHSSPIVPASTAIVPSRMVSSPVNTPAENQPASQPFSVTQVLFVLWSIGAVGYLVRQFGGYAYLCHRLKRTRCTPERTAWLSALEEQKQSLGICRPIPLYASAAVGCPMLVGFCKPALYLPLAMLERNPTGQLTVSQTDAGQTEEPTDGLGDTDIAFVFRHELIHYKHADLGLKLLLVLAQAVQWWNPLIYGMVRLAQEDIELACDAAVVKGMDAAQRRAYGETILRSAIAQTRQRQLVSCFAGEKETLMKRLEGIFDQSVKKRGVALVVLMAVVLLTVGATFSIGKRGAKDSDSADSGANSSANDGDTEAIASGITAPQQWDLAEEWAGRLTIALSEITQMRYTIRQDDEATYVITELEDIVPSDDRALAAVTKSHYAIQPEQAADAHSVSMPQREAYQLAFARNATTGQWEVSEATALSTTISSLKLFRIYYENDFGLPDWMHGTYAAMLDQIQETKPKTLQDPVQATQALLQLDATPVANEKGSVSRFNHEDVHDITFAFADGSRVCITTVKQYNQVELPQDWSDATGVNHRTATDLAQQLARGVQYKSGQFVYTILSDSLRQAFIRYQQGPSGDETWYWKLGGSSPSYRWFVNLPREPDKNLLVFQKYGGGLTDARSAYEVTVDTENGRSVITAVTECAPPEWKHTELFQLYYDIGTGMPMPDLRYGNGDMPVTQDYNGMPMDQLTAPRTAAEAAFSYFGEWVESETPDGTNVTFQPWFTIDEEVTQLSETIALVTVNFRDNSVPVTVQMEKQGDYWLPIMLLFDFNTAVDSDSNNETASGSGIDMHVKANAADFSANSNAAPLRVDAHIGKQTVALPVGATIDAVFAQDIPFLPIGTELTFLLAQSSDSPDNSTLYIADAMFREDGSAMFDSRVTETAEVLLTSNKDRQTGRYIIQSNPAALLRSSMETTELRGLTLTWTQNGVSHTAATVFRTGRSQSFGEAVVEIIQEPVYTNTCYGYTLRLPDSFVGQGFFREDFTRQNAAQLDATQLDVTAGYSNEQVQFGMVGAIPEISAVGTTGFLMSLHVEPTAFMKETAEIVPTIPLAERNGMSYFLTFASDVQYNPDNPAVVQTYQKMMADAAQLDASAFSFLDTDGEEFLYYETRTRLSALAHYRANAYQREREERQQAAPDAHKASIALVRAYTVIPEVDTMSCLIIYSLFDEANAYEIRRAERVGFDQTNIEPVFLDQNVAASDLKGTTLEKFLLLYSNPLSLPQYTAEEIVTLQKRQQAGKDDLSTPEAGSLRYAMSEAYATHETISAAAIQAQSADTRFVQYRFWDTQDVSAMKPGNATVRFTMRAMQVDQTLPPVWLAESAEVDCGDGTGWFITAGSSHTLEPSILVPYSYRDSVENQPT